ncbi:MAG TPA: cytochrome c oxidase subunit II [Acidimicrobiales bacterium]|nr:cytochrome c oxidase subunit II [Acidimicrobiales bacterium]
MDTNSLTPHGPDAAHISGLFWLMVTMGTVIYIVTMTALVVALFRGRQGARPSRFSDNAFIVGGGVVVPTLVLFVLAFATVRATNKVTAPRRDAVRLEVVGYQYWWRVEYHTPVRATTANEVHIPVGRPVDITLTSVDVNHSFWIPELAGKVDTIPGQRNLLHLQADKAGTYRGQCAEFCGLQHTHMAMLVIAEPQADFDRWVRTQARPAAAGSAVFEHQSCAGCHTIRGTSADGTLGPDLTHLAGRRTLGAVTAPNTAQNLAKWIHNAQDFKPGSLMPPVPMDPAELDALVAYLETLE